MVQIIDFFFTYEGIELHSVDEYIGLLQTFAAAGRKTIST